MAKLRPGKDLAWAVVKAIEASRREKDRFFEIMFKAYEKHPEEVEKIRDAIAERKISVRQALNELERLANS